MKRNQIIMLKSFSSTIIMLFFLTGISQEKQKSLQSILILCGFMGIQQKKF